MNFYSEGDLTHINQPLIGFNLPKCWDYCLLQSDFDTRRQDVDQFNRYYRTCIHFIHSEGVEGEESRPLQFMFNEHITFLCKGPPTLPCQLTDFSMVDQIVIILEDNFKQWKVFARYVL